MRRERARAFGQEEIERQMLFRTQVLTQKIEPEQRGGDECGFRFGIGTGEGGHMLHPALQMRSRKKRGE